MDTGKSTPKISLKHEVKKWFLHRKAPKILEVVKMRHPFFGGISWVGLLHDLQVLDQVPAIDGKIQDLHSRLAGWKSLDKTDARDAFPPRWRLGFTKIVRRFFFEILNETATQYIVGVVLSRFLGFTSIFFITIIWEVRFLLHFFPNLHRYSIVSVNFSSRHQLAATLDGG